MARPREFDEEEALHRAMMAFWRLGYDGASLPDLLEAMGLTRGSLYKAFTDKKSLFLRALHAYDCTAVEAAVAALTRNGAGRSQVISLFQSVVDDVAGGDRRGCMLCSAAAGPAAVDAEIKAAVEAILARLHQGFAAAVPNLGSAGAVVLVTQYVGLRVLARAGLPVTTLQASVDGMVGMLVEDG